MTDGNAHELDDAVRGRRCQLERPLRHDAVRAAATAAQGAEERRVRCARCVRGDDARAVRERDARGEELEEAVEATRVIGQSR